jgi:hypothetical protein
MGSSIYLNYNGGMFYSSVRIKIQLFELFLRPVKNTIVFYLELY